MAVCSEATTTARARETPGRNCVWMFSIETVASSTSTPTASARPPSVMMLIVCPVAQNAMTAANSANGMFITTISALRQSRKNSNTTSPVRSAPINNRSRSTDRSAADTFRTGPVRTTP